MDRVVGVTRNGVLIFSAISEEFGVDPINPPETGIPPEFVFDECLGTVDETGIYHYHMLSPCILDNTLSQDNYLTLCDSNVDCADDKFEYALQYYSGQNQKVIGVAKDGRLIYGPYNAQGQLWQPCDVDACNGRYIDGSYAYVATAFFPYFAGCWGPAVQTTLFPSCTSTPRRCSQTIASSAKSVAFGFISLVLAGVYVFLF